MNYLTSFLALLLSLSAFGKISYDINSTCLQKKTLEEINHSKYKNFEQNFSKWIHTPKNAKAITLITHGLNQKPTVMKKIENLLISKNHTILRVALTGHRGDANEAKTINPEDWVDEIIRHYCLLKKTNSKDKLPVNLIGFSLGGLLSATLTGLLPAKSINKMILFSPAIKVHWYADLFTYLKWLDNDFVFRSYTPLKYRSQKGTTVAMYKTLFNTIDIFKLQDPRKINIPTLIFIDQKDEMVSYSKIVRFRKEEGMTKWKIKEINKGKDARTSFHHLTIDEFSVGKVSWSIIKKMILEFI